MVDQVKSTYLAATELQGALTKAGNAGLRVRLFAGKEGSKDAFGGFIEVIAQPQGSEVGSTVIGLHAYRTNAKGEALVTKNGDAYLALTVGNRGDTMRGAMFTNTKRPDKKDADFRIVINIAENTSIEGKLWISEPKNGGAKYLSGTLGSKPEAEAAPEEAVAAPAAAAAAPAAADPFDL